jgi:hypothetical protein
MFDWLDQGQKQVKFNTNPANVAVVAGKKE